MEWAIDFLMKNRFNEKYGLIIGATTADWGDVQPEHGWGVDVDENTHPAIDIYDNAMFIIALNNLIEILPDSKKKWSKIRDDVAANTRKYLWDADKSEIYSTHLSRKRFAFSCRISMKMKSIIMAELPLQLKQDYFKQRRNKNFAR